VCFFFKFGEGISAHLLLMESSVEGGEVDGEEEVRELGRVLSEKMDEIDEVGFVLFEEGSCGCGSFSVSVDGTKLAIDLKRVACLYKVARSLFEMKGAALELRLSVSRVVLVMNADFETIWHFRERYLQYGGLKALKDELLFTAMVLTKHRKSSPTWAHRIWCLKILKKNFDKVFHDEILQKEFQVSERIAILYPRCYNAWCHRTQALGMLNESKSSFLQEERIRMRRWLKSHVSDHSAVAYSTALLKRSKVTLCELEDELNFVTQLILRYSGHESLWLYKRKLLHAAFQLVREKGASLQLSLPKSDVSKPEEREIAFDSFLNAKGHDLNLQTLVQKEIIIAKACSEDTTTSRSAMNQRGALGFLLYAWNLHQRHNNHVSTSPRELPMLQPSLGRSFRDEAHVKRWQDQISAIFAKF